MEETPMPVECAIDSQEDIKRAKNNARRVTTPKGKYRTLEAVFVINRVLESYTGAERLNIMRCVAYTLPKNGERWPVHITL